MFLYIVPEIKLYNNEKNIWQLEQKLQFVSLEQVGK